MFWVDKHVYQHKSNISLSSFKQFTILIFFFVALMDGVSKNRRKKPTKSSVLQVFKTRPGPFLPPPVVVNSVVYKSPGKAGY